MMLEEFEKRTGFYPTLVQYEAIERAYMDFDGDKDAFCKAYKKNADGIAERIQREVNMATFKAQNAQAAELTRRDVEIDRLNSKILEMDKAAKKDGEEYERRLADLQAQLDRELEWKPYVDTHNVTQADYADLAGSVPGGAAHYMTDEEALDWVCDEFGFDRSKVTILHEIDEYEVNRHHQLRRAGKKIDRRPVYCATDYHYIHFNAGCGAWQWEAWNGQLRPFYA